MIGQHGLLVIFPYVLLALVDIIKSEENLNIVEKRLSVVFYFLVRHIQLSHCIISLSVGYHASGTTSSSWVDFQLSQTCLMYELFLCKLAELTLSL